MTDTMSTMGAYTKMVAKALVKNKDDLLFSLIPGAADAVLFDYEQIKRRGALTMFPDGRQVFSWDGKPLVEFYQIESAIDGNGRITMTQPYRMLTQKKGVP